MRKETQNVLLILLGGALVKIAVDGSYLRYVKPYQQPWLILSGGVMVTLAVIAIARDITIAARAVPLRSNAHSGHSHRVRSTWMLVLPVLAMLLIAPPALGADTVNRSGGRTVAQEQSVTKVDFPPLPAAAVLPMAIKDVVTRAGWDATNSLTGRTIRVSGFITHQGNTIYLARLIIACCAADAFPAKLRPIGPGVAELHDDQWVEVTGTVEPDTATRANDYAPIFTIATLTPIPAPTDPYEY